MISINLINYNNGDATKKFCRGLDDLILQIDTEVEVVVVDNNSDDGSELPLKARADRFYKAECDRGRARNICLDMCAGDVTVDQLDTDQMPQSQLADIINWYYYNEPDFCINTNGCMVNTRRMIYPPGFGSYQSGEDKALWDRLIDHGKYKFLQINTAKHIIHNHDRSPPFYTPKYDYPQAHETHRDKSLEREIFGDG